MSNNAKIILRRIAKRLPTGADCWDLGEDIFDYAKATGHCDIAVERLGGKRKRSRRSA